MAKRRSRRSNSARTIGKKRTHGPILGVTRKMPNVRGLVMGGGGGNTSGYGGY